MLATWGYVALLGVTALSALGIPVGSELAIAYAGVLASGQAISGHHDHLSLAVVIVVATAGEVLGSSIGYAIGRIGGRPLVNRVGRFVLLSNRDLDRAEAWFAARGQAAVFIGRFVPLIRSFVSVAAGLGDMSIGRFLVFTTAACAIWCGGLSSIGYGLASSWHRVINDFSYAGYLAAALAAIVVVVFFVHRLRRLRLEESVAIAEQ